MDAIEAKMSRQRADWPCCMASSEEIQVARSEVFFLHVSMSESGFSYLNTVAPIDASAGFQSSPGLCIGSRAERGVTQHTLDRAGGKLAY